MSAGQGKPRTRAEEFVDRLREVDPAAVEQLRAALWNPDGSVKKGGATTIRVKRAGVIAINRYSHLVRVHWGNRAVGVAMAAPRGRRDHGARRRRRTGATRAAGIRSGQDPGEPHLDEAACRTPLREGAAV